MKILLIEDEIKLARFIMAALRQAGHVCDHATDGSKGLETAMISDYDLILLDLMLPSINGIEVLKNLRSFHNDTPVIILSALSTTTQVIEGLDAGAIDYLKKPFELDELLARVRALQRRSLKQSSSVLKVADLQMDLLKREVTRNGKTIALSNREFALLEYLLTNANRLITKSQILEKIWEIDFDPGSNIVEVHLYQLRKKMDKEFNEQLIHTVIGSGYILKGELSRG